MQIVMDENGEEVFGVACCDGCKTTLVYKKMENGVQKSLGNKNMLDHLLSCSTKAATLTKKTSSSGTSGQTIDSFFQRGASYKVPDSVLHQLRDKQTMMVASAHLPFHFVENEGFLAFCQNLINLGASHGRVDANKVIMGRNTTRAELLKKMKEVQTFVRNAISTPHRKEAVSFVTDLWTDNVVMRSYLDVTFFWVEECGDDGSIWNLKRGMFACKFFPEKKTSENIEAALDSILMEAGVDLNSTPVTTDKGANIVAATQQATRIDCACHRLSTAINTAWVNAKAKSPELSALDENVNNLVRFVKKSANIQHQLPSTLKSGGTTRPWRSLMQKYQSVVSSFEALGPILTERGRSHLLVDIDQRLLEEIRLLLSTVHSVFDLLEYSARPSIQSVLPAYYLLKNMWSTVDATDSAPLRIAKKDLAKQLDEKLWSSITAVHVASTWLDPSLKHFAFVRANSEKDTLLKQARECVLQYGVQMVPRMNRRGELNENEVQEVAPPRKITKITSQDPLAAFRFSSCQEGANRQVAHSFDVLEAGNVRRRTQEEIDRYTALDGPTFEDTSVFNPLQWWGSSKFRFPILSAVARSILVIQGASAESERHFSEAGRVARKDRNRLKPDAVEAQVLVCEGGKRGLIGNT